MAEAPRVRRARESEIAELAPLVYVPAKPMFERIAREPERALLMIGDELRSGMLGAVWIAELGGAVAGAMVAYPYREDARRARLFMRIALRRSPPWRWPAIARVFWRALRHPIDHAPDSLYIDALAVDARFRRRGLATALLEHAAQTAAMRGLSGVSLDTAETNEAAVALYRRAGFEVAAVVPADPPVPAILGFRRSISD